MSLTRTQYLSHTIKANDLRACIPQGMQLTAVAPVSFSRRYYDSFDWRLYKKGACLCVEQGDEDPRRVLATRDENEILAQLPGRDMPRFHRDLPPCRLQQRVSSVVKERALLPKLVVEGQRRRFEVRDGNGKTVLRIDHEHDVQARDDEHEPVRLPHRLTLQPIKGYESVPGHVNECIARELRVEPRPAGTLQSALARLGQTPGQSRDYDFEAHTRAIDALAQIGRVQLEVMLANQQGILDDIDTEFLHDFRVAVRRTRTLLTQAKGLIGEETLSWLKDEFRWLGQATGHARDMDVYLLHFPGYEAMLEESLRADLVPLRDFLQRERDQAYLQLHGALRSERYQRLIQHWDRQLGEAGSHEALAARATLPIAQLADASIWKTYRRVRKQGKAITPESPAEDYHTLRKTCKKLRYLLEFYRGLYPRKQIKKRIAELKLLQDNLGEFQDYQVQEQHLGEFAQKMQQQHQADVRTYLAMGKLIDMIREQSERVRREFARCFAAFTDRKVHRHFTETFKPAVINTTSENTGLL